MTFKIREQPDKKDMRILYALDLDGRASYSEIAQKIGMSKQFVKYRVERLEKEGFINGYYPMIDTAQLGFIPFRIYFKFRNLTEEKGAEIINYLKSQKTIWTVVTLAGQWDIGLVISVKDIYDFYAVWEAILKKYMKWIKDYKIAIYSPIYHYSKAYLIGQQDTAPIRILGSKKQNKVDNLDLDLLIAISKNARLSLLELSKKIKTSPEVIRYRLTQLEKKGIIQGYRALIDVKKLGYEYYKVDIRLTDFHKINQMLQFCHQHPNIYQVDKTIGGETLEIEFQVKSFVDMLAIIKEFENKFLMSVESYTYVRALNEEKTTYMPEV